MRAEKVLSRSGNSAILQAFAYYDNWDGSHDTVEYRCNMTWEDGQWKCSGLFRQG